MKLTKEISKLIASGLGRRSLAKKLNISEWSARKLVEEYNSNKPSVIETPKHTNPKFADTTPNKPVVKKLGDKKEKTKKEPEWIISANFINITLDGQVYACIRGTPSFDTARDLLIKGDVIGALELINPKKGIEKYTQGLIDINNGVVSYKGLVIDNGVTKRIVEYMRTGKQFKYMVKFLEKLLLNPSYAAVKELYGFLEHADIEINDDGDLIVFKRVTNDYKDLYTKSFDNGIGKRVTMDRNLVDDDRTRTCSRGLHVAAKSYIPHYYGGQGRIVVCLVNPKDVVSVPTDYNNTKMRVCAYTVLKDITDNFDTY